MAAVKLKEIADLERRVSRLEGDLLTLAKLAADLVRVPPPPFVLKPPFEPETPAEKIPGPRIA